LKNRVWQLREEFRLEEPVRRKLTADFRVLRRSFTPTPRRFRYGGIALYAFSNWGDLPIGVVSAIMSSPPFNDNDTNLGIAYVAIFILVRFKRFRHFQREVWLTRSTSLCRSTTCPVRRPLYSLLLLYKHIPDKKNCRAIHRIPAAGTPSRCA
jgi:hypothetical protein